MTIEQHKQIAKQLITIRQVLVKHIDGVPPLKCPKKTLGVISGLDMQRFRTKWTDLALRIDHFQSQPKCFESCFSKEPIYDMGGQVFFLKPRVEST
ncbi:MAG: hypothetical protein ACXADH_06995 [Candidatus Kariarchaeaceae archaeon]|jgi:hypothetical protein